MRSHLVTVSDSGLVTCAGGKWTTYRQMAEDAVDEAVKVFGLTPRRVALPDIGGAPGAGAFTTDGRCVTRTTPVLGSHGYSTKLPAQLAEAHGVDDDVARHLATNYGDRAWSVLAEAPTAATATARLAPRFPFIEAEVRHAVRSEAACTAADVISRRTRLAFLDVDAALGALPRVIDVMAEELGWGEARQAHEWTETVRFLRSMGLEAECMVVTREQVLAGDARARRTRRDAAPAAAPATTGPGGSGKEVGRGRELGAAGALASGA